MRERGRRAAVLDFLAAVLAREVDAVETSESVRGREERARRRRRGGKGEKVSDRK